MPSTFFGLNIGASGLYTYQSALNTTGQNASNVETPGYTRQIVDLKAGNPISVYSGYGMVGTGVTISSVYQVRNEYFDQKYRYNSGVYGFYNTCENYMMQIENYFNEFQNEGFTKTTGFLSNALQELSKDPTSGPVRAQITQYGTSLTEYVNSLAAGMKSLQEDCNFEIRNTVDRINAYAKQLATLNKQINTVEINGTMANDLRDQRNLIVDELSKLANVSVKESVVGDNIGKTSYRVSLAGHMLVDTAEFNTIHVVPRTSEINMDDAVGLYQIEWSDGNFLNPAKVSVGGTLQALFDMRDGNNGDNFGGTIEAINGNEITITNTNINREELLNIAKEGVITFGKKEYEYTSFSITETANGYQYSFVLKETPDASLVGEEARIGDSINVKGIPYYMNRLNEFVRTFAKNFNKVHNQGQYQDEHGNLQSGLDFFGVMNGAMSFNEGQNALSYGSSYYHMTASNFSVNSDIVRDPNLIVTTDDIGNGEGNTKILEKLIACMDDRSMFKEGAPSAFLQSFVADIGVDGKKAYTFAQNQLNLLESIENQRLSESGVDPDEEALNLVKYQNAYNLSAKVIQVMDEIYERLINYMGA